MICVLLSVAKESTVAFFKFHSVTYGGAYYVLVTHWCLFMNITARIPPTATMVAPNRTCQLINCGVNKRWTWWATISSSMNENAAWRTQAQWSQRCSDLVKKARPNWTYWRLRGFVVSLFVVQSRDHSLVHVFLLLQLACLLFTQDIQLGWNGLK